MERLELRIPTDLLAKLRAQSEKTGAPIAEIVRRAIESYLKKQK